MSLRLIICDLEATCWDSVEQTQSIDQMEIIEIGAVYVDQSGGVLDRFQCFIRPDKNPVLSDFCTRLTGIAQCDVDRALGFRQATQNFDAWLASHSWDAWASWGNYDRKQFSVEYQRHGVAPSLLQQPHINLKRPWRKTTRHRKQALRAALDFHGYQFEGSPHRALDDAINIARLLPHIDTQLLYAELKDGQHAV